MLAKAFFASAISSFLDGGFLYWIVIVIPKSLVRKDGLEPTLTVWKTVVLP